MGMSGVTILFCIRARLDAFINHPPGKILDDMKLLLDKPFRGA